MSSLDFASGVPRRKFKDFASGSSENVRSADALTVLGKSKKGLRSRPLDDLAGRGHSNPRSPGGGRLLCPPAFSYQRLTMTKCLSSLQSPTLTHQYHPENLTLGGDDLLRQARRERCIAPLSATADFASVELCSHRSPPAGRRASAGRALRARPHSPSAVKGVQFGRTLQEAFAPARARRKPQYIKYMR